MDKSKSDKVGVTYSSRPGCNDLKLLTIIIPARDEEDNIEIVTNNLFLELSKNNINHEIVVVDDGSTDGTWNKINLLKNDIFSLKPIRNSSGNGFGNAITQGIHRANGDAIIIMMADGSDDPNDVILYWEKLNEGWDCVFGSRFMKGSSLIDYPVIKLFLNRIANWTIMFFFRINLNDTTNAFKAYRTSTLIGCKPFLSQHFNLTVELPLKAIVRGYSWIIVPISWKNRRHGTAKLKIKEMGSRYFFIFAYIWLEKHFSKGDYLKGSDEKS